jgi:glycosyltransferase involved in cell wall biosynthesis
LRIVIDLEAAQSPLSRNRGIGRYSIALAKAMLRQKGRHEILVAFNGAYADTVGEVRRAFEGLLPQSSILVWHPAQPPQMAGSPGHRAALEAVRASFFASLHADIVHVASPFDFSQYAFGTIGGAPAPHRTAVTLYDLIPHVYSDVYLAPPGAADAYYTRLDSVKRADLWLAISESSRQEGIEHAGLPHDRVVNISSAADEHFVPGPVTPDHEVGLRVLYGLWRPFVMYTGGIDHRKNIEGLIEAWAALPPELRAAHQLAIVCSVHPVDRARLDALAASAGLNAGEVVFTGFVPEDHLLSLYRLCKLFVFPSLHEGFGLPALEAMSCGAPVIGSDNSSIPEVIGRDDAMFDAKSREAITAKIRQCLTDGDFRAELARYGPEQAKRFSWDRSARTALAAMETLAPEPSAIALHDARPRLAYVSPLPPEHSGIASYSSELIPALAEHYDIDLIVSQPGVEGLPPDSFRDIHDAAWFMEHGHVYDRVLYHFGNSHYHEYMVPLLRRHPGTVVLHDFFLSGMQANREFVSEKQPVWSRGLYESHGWRALVRREKATDMTDLIMEFPANFEVLRDAQGVIVHSPHSIELAREWYGPCAPTGWRLIPHLRVPLPLRREEARAELGFADEDFLVCSFGLLGPSKMNDRLMRAWRMSSLSTDEHCHLVFVGENVSGGEYGRELASIAMTAGGRVSITGWADDALFRQYLNAADVAVQLRTLSRGETSGTVLDAMCHGVPVVANANGTMAFLPREAALVLGEDFTDEQLAHALESLHADAAKRRAMGQAARHLIETQHSPADCAARYKDAIEGFAARARHGRAALERKVASLLPAATDDHVLGGIARAIAANEPAPVPAQQLLVDVSSWTHEEMSHAGLPHLLEGMISSPRPGWRAEPVYFGADGRWRYARKFMLHYYACNPHLLEDDMVEMRRGDAWTSFAGDALPAEVADAGLTPIELADDGNAEMAWAYVAATALPPEAPRCFVDISELVRHDWQSGIQRVVKNYLVELLQRAPLGQAIVPVYTVPTQVGYRVASAFLREAAQLPPIESSPGAWAEPRAGDTFFALDLQPHFIAGNADYLALLRGRGVRVVFMVYDLLPVRLPECFVPDAAEHHSTWLRVVAQSDMAICISEAVAHELREWIDANVPDANLRDIRHVHLGADLGTQVSTRGLSREAEDLLARVGAHPAFLMVGTIEPRKSHAQVLDAFELLWQRGSDAMLVIVGRPGWMTAAFVARLRAHPEAGKRLLWIEDATDEMLERLYESCSALILASRGEGFGLPLVEAAQRGLPIIARDLPVFREVAGDHAFYFGDDAPQALAQSIEAWLALREKGTHPLSRGMPFLTWAQSAAQLRRLLEAD